MRRVWDVCMKMPFVISWGSIHRTFDVWEIRWLNAVWRVWWWLRNIIPNATPWMTSGASWDPSVQSNPSVSRPPNKWWIFASTKIWEFTVISCLLNSPGISSWGNSLKPWNAVRNIPMKGLYSVITSKMTRCILRLRIWSVWWTKPNNISTNIASKPVAMPIWWEHPPKYAKWCVRSAECWDSHVAIWCSWVEMVVDEKPSLKLLVLSWITNMKNAAWIIGSNFWWEASVRTRRSAWFYARRIWPNRWWPWYASWWRWTYARCSLAKNSSRYALCANALSQKWWKYASKDLKIICIV